MNDDDDDDDGTLCPKCTSPILFALNSKPSWAPRNFDSNRAPTEVELQLIRKSLNETHNQISLIDTEIARLQPFQKELQSTWKTLIDQETHLSNLISPLRRLPPELLSEVFIHRSAKFDSCPSPLVLSQVCRDWRKVALSTPALWSFLSLRDRRTYRDYDPIPLARIWLSRSGQTMLSISIQLLYRQTAVEPFFELICDFSHRLKALSVTAAPNHIFALLSTPCGFPSLEWLSLSANSTSVPEKAAMIVAPKLTTLSVSDPHLYHDIGLPYSQLIELRIRRTGVQKCLSLIASCPSLQSCSIDDIYATLSSPPTLIPIVSNIRSLSLTSLHSIKLTDLLRKLNLPLLSEFQISTLDSMNDVSWFKDLAERSQFHLRKLAISCGYKPPCDFDFSSEMEVFHLCLKCTEENIQTFLKLLAYALSHSAVTSSQLSAEVSSLPSPRFKLVTVCSMTEEIRNAVVDLVGSAWEVDELTDWGSVTLRLHET
jgi:hypothetical protein